MASSIRTGERHIRTQYREFQPAAVGSNETKELFAVKAGMRVLAVAIMPLTAAAGSTTSTITVGDGGSVNGFVIATTNYDPEASTVGTLVDGTGTYLGAFGKLYTVDDTIDVVYTSGTAGATNPKVGVYLTLLV
jgi:hypothetical protein